MYKPFIDCKICKKRVLGNVWHIHVAGKKHMHYTPKKITVTGPFDADRLDDIHRYFARFGNIGSKKVNIQDDDKVAIEYCFLDKRAHSKIIYKDHKLFNSEMKVTWEEVTETPPFQMNQKNNVGPQNSNEYQRPSEHKRPVNKQPVNKQPLNKQPVNDFDSKQAILETLKGAFTFPEQVLLLQKKLQIDLVENEKKKKLIQDDLTNALSAMFPLNSIYFFGSSVTGLDVQGSDLDVYIANVRESKRPEVATLRLIRNLIFKCRKFCDVLLISGAKIPIIKCIHTKTQICCDLNIRNKLSVCNSQLIRYYLSLDEKMRPLMILIKFWADCYDLKKVNFFSSYALYMLVIFYLQHEPYNIPSVKDLQENIAPNLVEGWNCSFELRGFSSPSLRNELMPNLVVGFFKFYSNFDYSSKVISPYLGTSIDKICFLKPYDLPSGYREFVNNKQDFVMNAGICIQDPFEHSRSVSTSVPLSCAGKFVQMCRNSLKLMEEGTSDLLYKVLTQEQDFDYTFHFEKPENAEKDQWKQSIKDLTSKVLTDVLSMDISEATDQDMTIYTCKSELNIWDGRTNILKNLLTQLPPNIGELDKEIAATKCIAKYLPQALLIHVTVYVSFEEDIVQFTLVSRSKKCKNFLHAGHFFYVKLKKFLEIKSYGGDDAVSLEIDADKLSLPNLIEQNMIQKHDKISEDSNDEVITGKKTNATPNQGAGDVETNEGDKNDETSKADEENIEEEEEDIPADFFDDFSNEDFMDGLDIVDAWDEDKLLESVVDDASESSQTDKRDHSPIRFVDKSPEKRSKKYRSRSKSPKRHGRSNSHSRKRSRSREVRVSDRRDPEKTKRDINKDKLKCAKDREQKIVNDKLRIVETGLVPPGMEMETDLSTILKDKEKRRSGGSSERTRDVKLVREKRFIRRSNSRERKPSRYSPSPSSYRTRPREPIYRPRKRTSSVDSNLSDREMWIRSSRKRTRSRSRDSSHRHSKSKKYEEKKKKTFLEEIRDKLNETRTPLPVATSPGYPMYSNVVPHPIPAPVPAPSQYFPSPAASLQQYDQNFFIGDAYMNRPNVINPSFNMMGNAGNVVPMQVSHVQPVQASTQLAVPALLSSTVVSPTTKFLTEIAFKLNAEEKKMEMETDDPDKLYADKKISLSDFLILKSEAQSSSPEHLQKKIKVISRCQDAIKSMSDDRKFSGRLLVRPSTEAKNKIDVKNQSPLRRIPVVRFQFTSPAKTTEEVDGFALALDNILKKLGVLKESLDLSGGLELEKSNSSFADEEMSGLTLKASILNAKKDLKRECEECKRRKAKTFADVGSQSEGKETVNIAIQVNEEELVPNKGLAKNDSIAYMTPAQLLGMSKEKEETEIKGSLIPENSESRVESPSTPNSVKKEKPKPAPFKTRGSFRKTLRDRQPNYYEYDYENEEFEEYYEEPQENFGQRYGGPQRPVMRLPGRHFMQEEGHMSRLHQFREHEGNFTDFAQPFRGRGRFGPRY